MSAASPPQRETYTLTEACRRLGIGKTTGYELVRRDEFPCRVLRLGRRLVIPRTEIDQLLGIATVRQAEEVR